MSKCQLHLIILCLCLILTSCDDKRDSHPLKSTTTELDGLLAVVEIPAGTNKKLEYNKKSKRIVADTIKGGRDRMINFLPYPGNYGYIPTTMMAESEGGDGDALDVLILGESLETGTKLEIIPIAVLLLKDKGEEDSKIIAVPAKKELQIMKLKDFATFITEYNAAQMIIQQWFLNYKGFGKMEMLGWRDEKFAKAYIEQWTKE